MDTQETKIFISVLVAASILGVILVYFIISMIRHQRHIIQLQQQSLMVEINTLEKERRRIVSDLHDELGPLLSVAKIQISSLDTTLTQDITLIHKASQHLDDVLSRIRGICNELMPQVLIRKGLILALEEFISEINQHRGMQVSLSVKGNVLFDPGTEIHVYRIIQEITYNALKHAEASELSIMINKANAKTMIIVCDNGKGFNPEEKQKEDPGMGLRNISSRVEILRGSMYLDSKPTAGTTFTIEIPAVSNSATH